MDDTIGYAIIKKALSMFNIEIEEEDVKATENIKHEVALSLMWLDSAYSRVIHSFSWSFLTEPITVEELNNKEINTLYGYLFAYEIKEDKEVADIVTVIKNHDYHKRIQFTRYKNIIYTNDKDIEVFGIVKPKLEEIEDIVPIEFVDLIAYQLALLIAPSLSPKDSAIQQLIANQYNLVNSSLMRKETIGRMKRFSNEEVD